MLGWVCLHECWCVGFVYWMSITTVRLSCKYVCFTTCWYVCLCMFLCMRVSLIGMYLVFVGCWLSVGQNIMFLACMLSGTLIVLIDGTQLQDWRISLTLGWKTWVVFWFPVQPSPQLSSRVRINVCHMHVAVAMNWSTCSYVRQCVWLVYASCWCWIWMAIYAHV